MKIIITVLSFILMLSCNESQTQQNAAKENIGKYHNLGNEVFGIDMKTIRPQNVISIIKQNGFKYKVYEQNPSLSYPEYFESRYFIGKGIDSNKINLVSYSFPILDHVGYSINVHCNKEIYSRIEMTLKNKYGEPNIVINKNTGKKYLMWVENPNLKTAIQKITLSKKTPDEILLRIIKWPKSNAPSGH